MLLFRFFVVLILLMVGSCGFTPIYSETGVVQAAAKLREIRVEPIKTLIGVIYTNKLSDLLNPTDIDNAPKYSLSVDIATNNIALAIQQDRTITRYKIIVTANYKMIDIATKKIVDRGILKREGGYDKVESDYATYVSKEDTTQRVVRELAEDTRLRLVALTLNM